MTGPWSRHILRPMAGSDRVGVDQVPDITVRLGRRIRTLRLARGWTQVDLAAYAEIHRAYLSEVERGDRNIAIRNIEAIAHALGLPVRDLFPLEDEAPFDAPS